MKRTTVAFYDEIYQKLESRGQEKGAQSVAQSVRELVDLGLKVEAAASKSEEKNDEIDLLQALVELKTLLKSNLIWSLETRLLTRHLVENPAEKSHDSAVEILEKYKESALHYVSELVKDTLN